MESRCSIWTVLVIGLFFASVSLATQTENFGIRVIPAPGTVTIDGKVGDWDLSGGVFACDDVENGREQFAVWVHAMYDADNLYVLARYIDPTPLNNPGQTGGDYGFQGDCLQFRVITHPGTPLEHGEHFTCWKGRDGKDIIVQEHGVKLDGGTTHDLKTLGAKQGFSVDTDGKGYNQEIAIPWKLFTKDGQALKTGDAFTFTVEPNFTIGAAGRLTLKDIFRSGVQVDRVFTFMNPPTWGEAKLEPTGHVTPRAVRLSDSREFPVHMNNGTPTIDWAGLIKVRELPGFKPIVFEMPEDGFISLHLLNSDGVVVRQLLNAEMFTKGRHEVKWDGLTTPNWRTPGEPVPAGAYTWEAIYHRDIGLRLVGWACNGGQTPWDFPAGTGNWGGDHGVPSSVASDGDGVYLGWSAAEAGKALLGCDADGNVRWNNTHGGIAGASRVAVDAGHVYIQRESDPHGDKKIVLYRLSAKDGSYENWAGTDSTDLEIPSADALAARGGRIFLGYTKLNQVQVLDGISGKAMKTIEVPSPSAIHLTDDGKLFVIEKGSDVVSIDQGSGQSKPLIQGLAGASAIATDKAGKIYVAVGEPDNQVKVYDRDGKLLSTIGRKGGRPLLGKWQGDGMRFVSGIAIDANGRLWVMEADLSPKRVSVWDVATGKLWKEFFGATSYGAIGGAICPADANVMVGQDCEWKLDATTGKASCIAVISRDGMNNSRFGSSHGHLYLATTAGWAFNMTPVKMFERLGAGQYVLRSELFYADKNGRELDGDEVGKEKQLQTGYWADRNGDGQRQNDEVYFTSGVVRVSGWYMNVAPDMTLYAEDRQFKPTGVTACGALQYDLAHPTKMPAAGMGSADGRLVLKAGEYNVANSWDTCYDVASGKALWQYPDTFVGVHGSHNAPPPEIGLIRGSFTPCGVVKLPDPIGNVWVIPTNVGEWHLLTEHGFYLTRLFQADPLKVRFPERATPGAMMDNAPPGMGGEDFGGSVTLTDDGTLHIQAGKTAFWNVAVTGLDTVKAMKGGSASIDAADIKLAQAERERQLQAATGTRRYEIKRSTPTFSGNLDNDFKGIDPMKYQKQEDAAVKSVAAWDDKMLYVGWEVKDPTPWVNGATDAMQMYLQGDTVDLQLATNPAAEKNRDKPVLGDLRLSIGNLKGTPTAVIYREVAREKHPKVFSSGVIKSFPVESVVDLKDVKISVTKHERDYTIEAAIPLASLEMAPEPGKSYRADFGVTHGDTAGQRTRLRTYWNNQHTGIVDDAVFELQLEPKNWGEIVFEK